MATMETGTDALGLKEKIAAELTGSKLARQKPRGVRLDRVGLQLPRTKEDPGFPSLRFFPVT